MTSITVGSYTYNLCALPAKPGFASVEIGMNDTVAVATSPFTRWEQTQQWSGGDFWDASLQLPPMTSEEAACWRGFLAELRGRANVFQATDPSAWAPPGRSYGAPVVATSGSENLPMTWALTTRGWPASQFRILRSGMEFQVGYRLYMVTEDVNTDSSGDATIVVYPSLRETPPDGTTIVLAKPKGLFRLSSNRRAIQASPARLTTFSIKAVEAR